MIRSSADEFVSEIFKALVRRHSRVVDVGSSAHWPAVLQCGAKMFEAVALAMIAIKEKHEDLVVAKTAFDIIIAKLGLTIPRERHAILIKYHADLDDAAETPPGGESSPSLVKRDHPPSAPNAGIGRPIRFGLHGARRASAASNPGRRTRLPEQRNDSA